MPDERGSGGTDPTLTPDQALAEAPTSAESTPGHAVRINSAKLGALPNRYALGQRLGAGGMGEVVLARDEQIGRDVAIKRMRVEPTDAALTRFLREAKIQGRLDHPAIVPVHELANDAEGKPFFVMKRLTGTTLGTILAEGKLSRPTLLRAFADVCLAIEFAHRRGVVHRDLKPENIMLGDFGEVYVLDWGVAHVESESDSLHDGGGVAAGEEGTTEVGAILGTPGYIAPELLRGETIDGKADVFALGAMLFEILAGQPLLPRGRAGLDAATQAYDARPSVRAPDRECPPELEAIVVAATEIERAKRPTARELGERIERYLDGDRDVALRKNLAASHMDAARAALSAGDGVNERAIAMQEAGRAIALDPRGSGAAELVGRLMLEPPRETPPEVAAVIEKNHDDAARRKLRTMGFSMSVFLGIIPISMWVGIRSWVPMMWLGGVILVNLLHTWWIGYRKSPPTMGDLVRAALLFVAVIVVLSRAYSPFMMAPAIAAISAVLFLVDARAPFGFLVVTHSAAVLLPWLAELVGVAPRTMHELPNGDFALHSAAVYSHQPQVEIALAAFAILTLTAAGYISRQVALGQRDAMATTELQAWHLRQLVKS
jgi:serine/threonine-protein kinase